MVEELQKMFFEDMQIGDKVISVGRTITEADIVNFAGLSGDYNTLHTDAEFAKNSIAGERIAHGLLPLVISAGLFTRTPYNLSIMEALTAFTEIRSWKFKKPVVIGDTIRVEVEIIEKIDSKPESDNGKIVFKRTVLNQRDEVVQFGELVMLYKKKNIN